MKRWWASLATKVLGVQLAGLLTIAGVVGVTRYYSMRAQLYREVGTSAENLIQMIEETVAERPELLQPGALDPVVDRFTYKLPAVARVSLVTPRFSIVADSRLSVGQPSDQTALLPLLRRVGQERFYYSTKGGRYLRLSRSLRGAYDPARRSDIVGAVSIDMALAPADAAIGREMVGEMTLVMGLLIPISAVLVVLTRHRLIRPLEQLQEAGVRFGRGEEPAALTFSGSDELQDVGRAFNDMVEARTRALRERERQLAEAQAIAHVGSWEWDIATDAVTWSDEHCRLFGIPVGSRASYEGFVTRVHPDDRERVEGIIARGLAERRTEEYEWRLLRSDQSVRQMHTVSVVVTDPEGKPVRMAGTSVDITDRKMADENQQTLLRELQTALARVKTLQGWIRICANCKRVLTDEGTWQQFESYVRAHSDVDFSHGICPECAAKWSADAG
jgi:PAS domain S-box-containing protein